MRYISTSLLPKSILSAIVFLFLFPLSQTLQAQGKTPIFPWNMELRAGAAIPTGDFEQTVKTGLDLGIKFGYSLRERVILRGDVETELYPGASGFENTQLWHYSGGMEYMLTDKGLTEWRFTVFAGAGATTITSDNVSDLSETYFSVNYGAKLGKGINDNLDWFVGVMGRTVFANPEDNTATGVFTTIPITLGLNYRFNLNDKPVLDKLEEPPN